MIELGQLERRHEDFAKRNTRVVVASVDNLDVSKKTQSDFPHLIVLSDEGKGLTNALGILHAKAGPKGEDIDAPTSFLVDPRGGVRWIYRSPQFIARLAPDELLQVIDQHLK